MGLITVGDSVRYFFLGTPSKHHEYNIVLNYRDSPWCQLIPNLISCEHTSCTAQNKRVLVKVFRTQRETKLIRFSLAKKWSCFQDEVIVDKKNEL